MTGQRTVRPVLRQHRPLGRRGLAAGLSSGAAVALLVALLALIVDLATGGSFREIVLIFGINAVFVVGYQAFVGNTGIVSFGHVGFVAIGAYATGIVSMPTRLKTIALPDLPGFLATTQLGTVASLLVGGLAAAVVALIVGIPLMRLIGDSAGIATLGLLVIVNNVISESDTFTRGSQVFYGVPRTSTFTVVFATLLVVVVISSWLKWSSHGLEAHAVRDDPVAAEASGVRRVRTRLWPWVISAFITGVGGGLYAQYLSGFSPKSFFIAQIIGVLAMAIIGGMRSITGVLAGCVVISAISELLRRTEAGVDLGAVSLPALPGLSQLALGVLLLVMLRTRPDGLFAAKELLLAAGRTTRTVGGGRR